MWGDERGQEGSGLLHAVVSVWFQCVFCWHGDLVSDCRTTGPSPKTPFPPPDVQLLSQVSLLGTRREELHQGWSRITGPACLSGWAYFCWLALVLSSSQCCHHWADPFDVLIRWPPHRNNSQFVPSKVGGIVLDLVQRWDATWWMIQRHYKMSCSISKWSRKMDQLRQNRCLREGNSKNIYM